ncbi:hypothetical protein TUM4438_41350 [Shewanella sairae]|uniref:Uncharacterized protein n=1 Tax=Shewanella sairae TaxID=190310 RepID=A0ABQ4PQM0_9GAMM|nr:hypothetical protein [Shewanella sairae]MCL1132339.1 hypothetical protein [Shewanella sairae]GIU51502.1 hypothetical protein TUM4438_41350 [Shewanella sairae]
MDKLTQAVIETSIPQVRQDLVELEQTLEGLPTKISESIDETVNSGVNKIIEASQLSQQHADELQKQTSEQLARSLQKAQIDFILGAKESANTLFTPQLDQLVKIVNKMGSNKHVNSNARTLTYMFLSVVLGCIGGVAATNYKMQLDIAEEKAKTEALYSAQLKTVEETLNEKQQAKFNSEFKENFKSIYFK